MPASLRRRAPQRARLRVQRRRLRIQRRECHRRGQQWWGTIHFTQVIEAPGGLRMIWATGYFCDLQGTLKKRLGFGVIAHRFVEFPQVVDRGCGDWMIRAKGFLGKVALPKFARALHSRSRQIIWELHLLFLWEPLNHSYSRRRERWRRKWTCRTTPTGHCQKGRDRETWLKRLLQP